MTSISKKIVYFDKLGDIVNKYNNAYHKTIKIKPVDVMPSMYIGFNTKTNKEGPKYKVGDNVRILKYKNIFTKDYIPNQSGKIFVIRKVENTVPWKYVISDLNEKEIVGTFCEKKITKNKLKRVQS